MDVRRPASISSYFAHPLPSSRPYRLLLRVYAAEGLQLVASQGSYCKVYVGHTDMVHGSSTFARRTQQLTSSASSHSLTGLLHSSRSNFSSSRSLLSSRDNVEKNKLGTSVISVRKTQTRKITSRSLAPVVWNEKFDIPVANFDQDVLSIRVKTARLMASSAIGACSLSLKHVVAVGAPTLDRWVELKRGTKNVGRIRLQMRLVDVSPSSGQECDDAGADGREQQERDTHLSVPAEETVEDIAARSKKSSRRGHKYHRSARRFDGRPVTNTALASSCSTNSSSSSRSSRRSSSHLANGKDGNLKRVSTARRPLRNHSGSATSSESIDDSDPVSDASGSPVVSPRHERSSSEDGSVFCDMESSFAMDRRSTKGATLSPWMTAAAVKSFARMRKSELECSRMNIDDLSRGSRTSGSSGNVHGDGRESDDDSDGCGYRCSSNTGWADNYTKSSMSSSISDPRGSSRMDFDDDDDDDDEWNIGTTKESGTNRPASVALSSVASSAFDARESSRLSFWDSESEDEESDDVKLEKAREQQRQQWQIEQRKKQLAAIEELPQSVSDDESDEDDDDQDGLEFDLSRMQFTPTLATLLTRESNNVLIEEEDDEEGPESHKMSEEFVPILEGSSLMSVDFVDGASRWSSFG
uniref:C2 domain-containing protein n=1 Tax=Peronospora matthiolae TaxID=2874970 RepID=A0AAV1UT73_9STRA